MSREKIRFPLSLGFSLLEILFSIAILSVALSGIGYLTYSGMVANTRSVLQNEGLWHAQTILEEIIAGSRTVTLSTNQPVDSETDWYYRVVMRPDVVANVRNYEVTVWKTGRWRDVSEVKLERMIHSEGTR